MVMFVCDTGRQADAGRWADDREIICAHRIEARVARSRGDSAEIFTKFDKSVRFRLLPRVRNSNKKSGEMFLTRRDVFLIFFVQIL